MAASTPITPNSGAVRSANGTPIAHRRIAGSAGSHHHSAQRLNDRVHGFAGAWFALASEAGDGAVDDARIHFLRKCVARAQAIQRAAAEVFDDDVGGLHQVGINAARFGMLQVQRHAQFVAKPVESGDGNIVVMLARERSSFGAQIGCIGAAGIASADGVLDLDDLGSQSRQQQSGERAGQRRGQIENRDVFKRSIFMSKSPRMITSKHVWL